MGNFRKHSPRVFWSEAEVNILMEHYPSLSAAELLEKLPGRTIRVIQCKANGLGLSRTKPKKRTAEQTREAKRKHMAERRAENPEAMRAVSRNFHRKHKERINAQRRGHHVTRLFWTRALKFRGVTASDLAKLWKAQRGLCALTGRKMDRSAQVDPNARQASAFRPGKESAKPVRASLGANDQSAAVVREHQPCELFPIARA